MPSLTTSLRGAAPVVVEVRVLEHAVHSGLYGGPVPDALTVLCRLLATLHDEHGDVAVAGMTRGTMKPMELSEAQLRADAAMLDGVELIGTGELTDRLWAHPSITVIGIDAPSVAAASNTLLPSARAKVSLRVPPGNDVTKASDALAAHLKAHAPWGVHVTVHQNATGAPYTAQTGGAAYQAAHWALGEAFGRPAADIGGGGSIPFVTGYARLIPEAEILISGVEDPDTRAHGANESLHLTMFERVCIAETLLLHRLGETGQNG